MLPIERSALLCALLIAMLNESASFTGQFHGPAISSRISPRQVAMSVRRPVVLGLAMSKNPPPGSGSSGSGKADKDAAAATAAADGGGGKPKSVRGRGGGSKGREGGDLDGIESKVVVGKLPKNMNAYTSLASLVKDLTPVAHT
jgi:hypothetical protein